VLTGAGAHRFSWRFHAAPGVELYPSGAGMVRIQAGRQWLVLHYDPRLEAKVVAAWYAPSYGARTGCNALVLTLQEDLASPLNVAFKIAPAAAHQ